MDEKYGISESREGQSLLLEMLFIGPEILIGQLVTPPGLLGNLHLVSSLKNGQILLPLRKLC